MKFKITAEALIRSVKIWSQVIVCWPPPLNATRKCLIIHNVAWCGAMFFMGIGLPAIITHAWVVPGDTATLTKDFAECLALLVSMTKMIISKCQQSRIQVAHAELETFLKTANPRERAILDRYMSKCGKPFAFFQILCLFAVIAFSCGPIILPQPVPGQVEYPFEWRDSPMLILIIYSTNVVSILQIAAASVFDIHIALLLLYFGIRFELLAEDFEKARSSRELCGCIVEHQKLIASVNEITIVVRYFVVNVIVNTGITNICCGYQFVSHQPIEVILQFLLLFCVTSVELAIYAWPADNLLSVSENIAWAVYASPWVGKSRKVTDGVQLVIVRSQKPMVIAVDGLLPKLNLDFYGKFLTTSFSYFTTLRAIFG